MLHNSSSRQKRDQARRQLISNFTHTTKEFEYIEQFKKQKLFRIQIRFKRCQTNHTYCFPRTKLGVQQADLSEDQEILAPKKSILYNLNTQDIATEEDVQKRLNLINKDQRKQQVQEELKRSPGTQLVSLLHRAQLPLQKMHSKEILKSIHNVTETNQIYLSTKKPIVESIFHFPKINPLKNQRRVKTQSLQRVQNISLQKISKPRNPKSQEIKVLTKDLASTEPNSPRMSPPPSLLPIVSLLHRRLHTEQRCLKRKLIIDTMRKFQLNKQDAQGGNKSFRGGTKSKDLIKKPMF